jgi:hypothetical protein
MLVLKGIERKFRYDAITEYIKKTTDYLSTRNRARNPEQHRWLAPVSDARENYQTYLDKFVKAGSGILHQEVHDTYFLHAGKILMDSTTDLCLCASGENKSVSIFADNIRSGANVFQVEAQKEFVARHKDAQLCLTSSGDGPQDLKIELGTQSQLEYTSSITLTPNTIKLSIRGGPSITLTSEAIVLSCGPGASTIQMNAAKITQLSDLIAQQAQQVQQAQAAGAGGAAV